MSRQLNFNIVGMPGVHQAVWQADTGQQFPLQSDVPGRMIVKADDPTLHTAEGSSVTWNGQQLARLLIPPDGFVGEAAGPPCEMTPPTLTFQPPPPSFMLPSIVGDAFLLNGNRWVWRMTDGYMDVARLFYGQDQQVRDCHKQAQDLDSRGRRKFLMCKNIPEAIGLPAFDPRADSGRFFAALNKSLELDAEYGQPSNYVVFADAGLFGMPLGWCQEFWAECCDTLNGKAFITLVNQWNHVGNLVGRPDDYPNPGGLASQGSADEDTNPPNPQDGSGAGYQFWEWCSSVNPTHWSHEWFIQKGLSTGRAMPCVISEPGNRLEVGQVDLDYVRRLTHASMANGMGITIHSTLGKNSQLLVGDVADAVKLSMSLCAAGQA